MCSSTSARTYIHTHAYIYGGQTSSLLAPIALSLYLSSAAAFVCFKEHHQNMCRYTVRQARARITGRDLVSGGSERARAVCLLFTNKTPTTSYNVYNAKTPTSQMKREMSDVASLVMMMMLIMMMSMIMIMLMRATANG